ncbi:hypothetical protein DFQ28_006729 [Apophysomyces sp. BC1034]|nr:hypothetical protein DFQ30_006646 [Apophysomyces sp. BC1015]KAG0176988.1 hypothetical protein DFQ29_005369 [Apophysomyces sp. BC1021]KAG0187200.1 hypothetical protein DFQ28_006729 [Apophysomyces sp. BC1034]
MHPIAATGFQLKVDDYANARPSYPAAALQRIKEIIPQEAHVLDLAAGTGIMTQLLVPLGYQVTAVEPADNMRNKLKELLPEVPCFKGTAQNIPVPSESQDAVVIAQAFHWFDDIESLNEIHRVLKPQGHLILIWNTESPRSIWTAKLRQLYEKHTEGVPSNRTGRWRQVFDTDEAKTLYDLPLEYIQVTNDFPTDKDRAWSRVISNSYVAILPEDEIQKLKKDAFTVLDDPENEFNGVYSHETDLVWVRKRV